MRAPLLAMITARVAAPLLVVLLLVTACSSGSDGDGAAEEATGSTAEALMPAAICDAEHPTHLAVSLFGADGASVNGIVGVDLEDAAGTPVTRDGAPNLARTSYPIALGFNFEYGPEGEREGTPGEVRTWNGCVAGNVARAYFEAYPKDQTGRTNLTKYGETDYQYLALTPGEHASVNLRFPVVFEYAEAHGVPGGTGNIFGHVFCNGAPAVPDHAQLRVWSAEAGDACGIRAYSAAAEGTDSAYKFSALAGGQCWAPSQSVVAHIRGNCGGRYREVQRRVNITTGKTLPLDVDLATGTDEGAAH